MNVSNLFTFNYIFDSLRSHSSRTSASSQNWRYYWDIPMPVIYSIKSGTISFQSIFSSKNSPLFQKERKKEKKGKRLSVVRARTTSLLFKESVYINQWALKGLISGDKNVTMRRRNACNKDNLITRARYAGQSTPYLIFDTTVGVNSSWWNPNSCDLTSSRLLYLTYVQGAVGISEIKSFHCGENLHVIDIASIR